MNKLIMMMATIVPTVPIPLIMEPNLNTDIINNNVTNELIDLSKLDVKPIELNLNQYNDVTSDQVREAVLEEMILVNDENEVLVDVLWDIYFEPDNWKTSGINFEKPSLNEYELYHARFIFKNRTKYKGILAADITLFNKKEKIDLENIIENKDLGELTNPNGDLILEEVFNKNNNIEISQLNISETTYESARISAKSSSTMYVGSIYVTFTSKIEFNINKWDSGRISAEAYNSHQIKEANHAITYETEFGTEAFLQTFDTAIINYDGYWKTTGLWPSQDREKTIEDRNVELIIGRNSTFWSERYPGEVNWNSSDAWIETNVLRDEIEFSFNLNVQAYASWINAYWSRAYGQLAINSISFN